MIKLDHIKFPDHSRVWIYQADRKLSAEEKGMILSKGKEFTSSWAAHGHELMADIHIELDHFIILVLDEQVEAASGCSIDKSMKFVLDLQKDLGTNFTNRLISAVWTDNGVQLYSYQEAKTALENGEISSISEVFDNTAQNLNELKTKWLKPLKDTWLKKLLEPENVQ